MKIRNFQDNDITEASALAKLTWGDFYTQESNELQELIYEFMVEYYDLNRKYSFSAVDKGLKGFLLAYCKKDFVDKFLTFKTKVQKLTNIKEQQTALNLYNYLETCGEELKEFITDQDIVLGLFVSIQKGCGKMLLNKLLETCKENKINNIYLWTDTTCDYKYYKNNNFIVEKEIQTIINNKSITTLIYKKEI